MSGRYRYEPSNGWLWILPPVGPSFASVYEKSASGADSNSRAVREIVIELNRLLDRAEKAETALADATQAHANERYQLQNAAIVAVEAQRKAEARVAELRTMLDEATDRSDLHFNNLSRTLANQRDEKQAHALTVAKLQARVAELERDVPVTARCQHCGTLNEAPTARWEAGFVCGCGRRIAKTAPQTPVPAPEGTETVQKAPPPSPVGAPRSDRGANSAGQVENPGPGRSDPRASESSNLDTPIPRPSRMPLGIVEAWQDGDRVFGTYAGGPQVELVPVPPDDGPVRTFVVKDPVPDAFRVYDEMLRNPGHPQRGLTTEEVDLTKPQTLRAYATFGEASPENSIRILVDPAAAAEVEARTGAYGRGLTKDEDAAYEAVLHGFMRDAMKGLDESMIGAIHEDAPCEIATLRMLPRAGLPSRDEVAAFLEARWPGGWRVNVRDVRIYK